MALLEVRGLVKRFLGVTAVDRVDLVVEPGELVSLIGPNGSGKTTLFNCITGYLAADDGRALFRGRDDVFAVRWEARDGRTGYAPANRYDAARGAWRARVE